MKLPLKPPLIGMLPLKRKSMLFFQEVTALHAPSPVEFNVFQVSAPVVPVMSIGWLRQFRVAVLSDKVLGVGHAQSALSEQRRLHVVEAAPGLAGGVEAWIVRHR